MAHRDNVSGVKRGFILTIILLPGLVMQWFMYMLPGSKGKRGYASVRSRTRLSRSPIMTWFFSIIGWIMIVGCVIIYMEEGWAGIFRQIGF